MKLIIVGATPFQREMWETLNKDRVIEVEFIDSIVKIEPNKLWGKKADSFIIDDLIDFNQGKKVSSLDDIKLTDENGFYPFERLFDSRQIAHGLDRLNIIDTVQTESNQVIKKQITYGPKQSCGKGKTKRWK